MIDQTTPHFGLPLPHPQNRLETDVGRLRAALIAADAAMRANLDALGVHGDQLADVLARVIAAEQKSVRYAVTWSGMPSQTELLAIYRQAANKPDGIPPDATRLVNVVANQVYTWFAADATWHGPASDVATDFALSVAGLITGGDQSGEIEALPNGKGRPVGWPGLMDTVAAHQADIAALQAASTPPDSVALAYDVQGRLTTVTETGGGENKTITLAYDARGRVSTVTTVQGGVTRVETLIYNSAGTLTGVST